MFVLALLGPIPTVEQDAQARTITNRTVSRAMALLMVSLFISVACGWPNGTEIRQDRQRSNSCSLIDEVRNIDTQRNVDCFER
jgi:hypothetical protein